MKSFKLNFQTFILLYYSNYYMCVQITFHQMYVRHDHREHNNPRKTQHNYLVPNIKIHIITRKYFKNTLCSLSFPSFYIFVHIFMFSYLISIQKFLDLYCYPINHHKVTIKQTLTTDNKVK